MIRKEDIDKLILAGQSEELEHLLPYFKRRGFLNRMPPGEWKGPVSLLTDEEIIHLYKGLIRIEKRLKWLGGSIASAIWIYRTIQSRKLDENRELAKFGLRESDNDWVPFGSAVMTGTGNCFKSSLFLPFSVSRFALCPMPYAEALSVEICYMPFSVQFFAPSQYPQAHYR